MKPVWAVGLMTGTVLDGYIDIAMIKTDGVTVDAFGPWELTPYPIDIRDLLGETFRVAQDWQFQGADPAIFKTAEDALTEAQALAVNGFLEKHAMRAADVAAIGFHGQTVLHEAPSGGKRGHTRQLGNGDEMARIVGTSVVYDFRSLDMEAGGQGAPLSAIYHKALMQRIGAGSDTIMLNLGGVANLTWCDGDTMIAFDTGPANAPTNDWVRQHTGADMDVDGALARSGTVDEARLAELLRHPFLSAPYPKSLDRFDFKASMADGLSLEDGAATLTAFTAGSVAMALDILPKRASRMVVCGGGRKNPFMMAELARRTGTKVVSADDVGLRGDAVEAECFAFLAVRSIRGLPLSFPLTTGVKASTRGGIVATAPIVA